MNLRQRWHQWITNRLRIWLGVPSIGEVLRRVQQNRDEGKEWNAKIEQKRQELEAFANKLNSKAVDIERRYAELSRATQVMEGVAGKITLALFDSVETIQVHTNEVSKLLRQEEKNEQHGA
jgi:gas vesicle protein